MALLHKPICKGFFSDIIFGGVSKSMLALNESIIDIKEH